MASSGSVSSIAPSPIAGVWPSGSSCRRTRPAAGIVASVDISGSRSSSGWTSSRPLCLVAHVGDLDDDEVAAAQRLGDGSIGGNWRMRPTDVTSSGVVSVQSRQAVSTRSELLPRPDHPAGEGLLEREELELDRRDDAEVAAAAAQREEEVALVRVVDAVELAVGRDDLDRRDRVRREAVLAGQPAHAAAERVAGDADVGRGAVQGDEAVLGRRVDDVLPDGAGADAGLTGLGVDLDVAQLRACARARRRRGRRAWRRRDRCPGGRRAARWPCAKRTTACTSAELAGTTIRARAAARRRRSRGCAPRPSRRPRGRGPNRERHDGASAMSTLEGGVGDCHA